MIDEEKKILNERMFACPHCNGRLPNWMKGAFRGRYLNKKLNTFRSRMFCTKECYEDYKKDFIVEVYNEQPIYCVKIDEEKRYMPYFEANYYFTNIDDCKKRMDMKNVAVVDMNKLSFMWSLSM